MNSRLRKTLAALTIGFLSPAVAIFAQGPLTPPGAPAATMRTLLQIEPRTPISALPFTISTPGSYYLTTNLSGTSGNSGITVSADNVTLDLMGFTLTGVSGSLQGVAVPAGQINLSIYNGQLKNWGGFGINASNVTEGRVRQVNVVSNGSGGLTIGSASMLDHCASIFNTGAGIAAGDGSSVKDCVTRTNNGSGIMVGSNVTVSACACSFNAGSGIQTGDNASVKDCAAGQNGQDLVNAGRCSGILVNNNCTVIGCTANNNDIGLLSINETGPSGITAGANCIIVDCTANNNDFVGIQTGVSCKVKDCTACNNNSSNNGEGMNAGDGSLITGCVASGNRYWGIGVNNYCSVFDNSCSGAVDAAIHCFGSHNVVLRNTCNGFAAIAAGTTNLVGTIETNSANLNADKNPHANYAP